MKIKTFKSSTMPLALDQVKQHLGPDAVILHTRTIKRSGFLGLRPHTTVEISARKATPDFTALRRTKSSNRLQRLYSASSNTRQYSKDETMPSSGHTSGKNNTYQQKNNKKQQGSEPQPAKNDELMRNEISNLRGMVESLVREQRQLHAPQMPEQLFDIYLELIQREVADEIAREMITHIQRDLTGNQIMSHELVRQKLVQVIDNMISTTGPISPNINGKVRVVALIGPTGVGKTTSIAKIAANLKLHQNKKVGLITIDTYRIGAVDQLRMYAQIIDVPLQVVLTPAELREAVELMHDMDVVLIDTAGRSQKDGLKIKELKTFLDAVSPDEIHLVLSSTANQSHMLNVVEQFKSIGVDRLILTKLDEAISFGVVLSVLRKVDASISYITTGQDVPDDIEIAGSRKLARMLLGFNEKETCLTG